MVVHATTPDIKCLVSYLRGQPGVMGGGVRWVGWRPAGGVVTLGKGGSFGGSEARTQKVQRQAGLQEE